MKKSARSSLYNECSSDHAVVPLNQSIQTPCELLLTTLNADQSNAETIKQTLSFEQFKFIRATDTAPTTSHIDNSHILFITMLCELEEWAVGDCDDEQEQLGEFLYVFKKI